MGSLEKKVKKCYETAPFPDSLRKAPDFNKELNRIIKWIILNLKFLHLDLQTQPKTILCAGCGTGEEAIALAKIFPKAKIDAIDISRNSLKIARANIKRARVKSIALANASILEGLAKTKRGYDLIYCAGVIHHLVNPRLGFKILTKKLNRNGKLVVMLYNSYGLFLYKLQLALLTLFAGKTFKSRMKWVKILGWNKNKNKVFIFDTYINPQVKTFTVQTVKRWAREDYLHITGIVPPMDMSRLASFAIAGKNYIFRRKRTMSIILKLLEKAVRKGGKKQKATINLSPFNIIFYQIIFLLAGKGECQFLFEKQTLSKRKSL